MPQIKLDQDKAGDYHCYGLITVNEAAKILKQKSVKGVMHQIEIGTIRFAWVCKNTGSAVRLLFKKDVEELKKAKKKKK